MATESATVRLFSFRLLKYINFLSIELIIFLHIITFILFWISLNGHNLQDIFFILRLDIYISETHFHLCFNVLN